MKCCRSILSCASLILLLSGIAACSSQKPPAAPIINGWHEPIAKQGVYIVRPHDGLYAIAWRYGVDYRDIVRINHLQAPYSVQVGQKLYLVPPTAKEKQMAAAAAAKPPVTSTKAAVTKPITTKPAAPKPASQAQSTAAVSTKKAAPVASTNTGLTWQWPAEGKVAEGFNGNNMQNKGVDIVNKTGTPIKAAADGQVVYSGSGLPGYGYLIIIKHNDIYLSAYAHNSVVLVKEGQRVKAGQTIARMGNTGADKVMLHFEIRRRGQPIDPESLLPKR